jgi:putative transcriptional regulator
MDFFEIINFDSSTPKQGSLLISEPFLFDPYFKRTVILLSEHNKKGSVLNKPINLKLNDVISDFPKIDAEVYFGGPVNQNNLFYIHTVGKKITGCIEIFKGLYWGGDFDTLKFLIDTKQINSSQIRFFAGYSGWSPNQLEKEMKEKSWISTKSTIKLIMSTEQGNIWSEVLKKLGKKFEIMSKFPEDPAMN